MEFWLIVGGGYVLYLIIKSIIKSSGIHANRSQVYSPKKSAQTYISSSSKESEYNENDDDDGFATFTISYGYNEPKSKNKTPGRWISPGETIKVKDHIITKGNFYFGGKLPSIDNYGTEASLIDETLEVTKHPNTYEDESLSYWPKYISISKSCRGAFLDWLASDREDPATPLGYVFIYFYGLERRVAVDSIHGEVEDTEFKSIFEEISRLKKIYGHSRSFLNYSTRLLEIMCILRPGVVFDPELEKNPKQDSILLKYRLAKTVNEGKPIPSNLALAWLKFIPDYSLRKPARRCAFEFSQLFSRLYCRKYGDGITVKPNKTRLKIEYWPASSSLRGVELPQEDLPDPSNLKGPARKLTKLADECTDALDAYSRYLGKSETSRTDIAAILLLPEELSDIGTTLGLGEFKKWAENSIDVNGGLVDVNEFWQFTKTSLPEKINKKESELIRNLAEKAGFGVAPDICFHHAKPTIDDKLVLFKDGHGKYFEPSSGFSEMGMVLRLGAMVATIDSHVDEAEYSLLRQLVDHDTNLSPVEKRSLHAYLVWRINTPSNISGLKARLEKIGHKEKAAVSEILVNVALADGRVDPDEVKQLEKLYKLLGLDKSLVTTDIHNITTSKASTTPALRTPDTLKPEPEVTNRFKLDESVLAIHELHTKDVQAMLSAIFEDETVEETAISEVTEADHEDLGIDSQHYALYERLINRDRWPRTEIDKLCKNIGLMTSGAIERINDWSFERIDAPVLEEAPDAVYVDQEIVEELEG